MEFSKNLHFFLFFLFCVNNFGLINSAPQSNNVNNRVDAITCNESNCKLPDCRCSSTNIPGNLNVNDTPQFVMLTFDDAVTIQNIDFYQTALNDRVNQNGCPVAATYYVSHEYTDYSLIHKLYSQGHEIAMHSITHSTNTDYWKTITVQELEDEFAGERTLIANFANIPEYDIKGVRLPFLQISGDNSYAMMYNKNITYDCSWPSQNYLEPGMWPYTLDYKSTQDCVIGPCPVGSHPGVWVIPMLTWKDQSNVVCAMVDTCLNVPADVDGLVAFMITNFERTYKSNRAPMGFYVHAAWFTAKEHAFAAYVKFIDYLQTQKDVFLVGSNDVINWVKNPIPASEMTSNIATCRKPMTSTCTPKSCKLDKFGSERWMTTCTKDCPAVYPWLGNPLGVAA